MEKEENRAAFKRNVGRALRAFLVCAVAAAVVMGCRTSGGDENAASSGFRITKFVINDVEGVINQNARTIEVVLSYGIDVTALLPTVEFVGAKIAPDPAKGEPIDFSAPVKYTVHSKDGSVFTYLVTVTYTKGVDFPAEVVIDNMFVVSNTAEWGSAVNAIKGGGNDKNYIIDVTGNFAVAGTTNGDTFGNITGITVAIRGNKTIELSGTGNLLSMGGSQSVILRDITFKGRTDNDNPLVVVEHNSKFDMRGDAKVTGNNSTYYGGGVYVSNGNFTMWDNASVSGNTATYGGGVCAYSGSFTMRDNASVSGNTANYNGGGVYVSNGFTTFTMQDNASVSGNTANDNGGGVYVIYGSFTIRDNASVSGNNTTYGGGVYVDNATFTMRDNASLSDNTAKNTGGGVYVIYGAFRMAGGTVYGSDVASGLKNTAPNSAALDNSSGTPEYGTGGTDGVAWISNGTLNMTDNTIKVVNGELR